MNCVCTAQSALMLLLMCCDREAIDLIDVDTFSSFIISTLIAQTTLILYMYHF